ncbi:hypothetical protein E5D57_011272 [Metarhizium anisopliae]|nr:hypothetical protein E5D57_011272 [Metarhizium anisopliae]
MVFYAYAKNSNDDWSYRYVIVAPNFNILDAWYYEVKDKVADNVFWRVSNEFYVFDAAKLNLGRSTAPGHEAPKFMNKLIFQLLNDNEGRNISTFVNGHLSAGTAE